MYYWEAGTYASLAGLSARIAAGEHGVITADQVRETVRADNPHFAPLKVVCIENTHNKPRWPRLVGRRGGRSECRMSRTRAETARGRGAHL